MSGFDPQRRRSIIASSSRNSSPSSTSNVEAISSELEVNARAQVQGKIGTIRFVGTTSFQTGKWVGIELDDPQGKNSGVVQGKRYFECKTNHGVFVRPSQVKVISENSEESDVDMSPSISERARFAPAQDPNLAAARNIQQLMPASSSSSTTLLPSRITSPSRISRLPLTPTSNKKASLGNRKSASPTASITSAATRKSKVASFTSNTTARPRSNTSTQKDLKENKLLQLRLQQQERLALIQQQQQQQQEALDLQQQEEEEEEAELQRQLQEEEALAAAEAATTPSQSDLDDQASSFDNESNETSSDRGVGLVSTTSSTAMPTTTTTRMSQQQSYGSLAANLPISKSDQMIPLKDYEELRLKLKILESKRQEDRERYREHEKVKEEAEQFLTLRNKLQGKKERNFFFFCIGWVLTI
jgi:dynactin 1